MTKKTISKLLTGIVSVLAMLAAMLIPPGTAYGLVSANLGVDLGGGAVASADVELKQDVVYQSAIKVMRKWREDAYNDSRIKFSDGGTFKTIPQLLRDNGMSKDEYLNPKWSNALERIAVQRAFEASYYWGHERLANDPSCFSATVDGKGANGEVLATSWGTFDITSAFELWMTEKDTYIKYVNASDKNSVDYGTYGHYSNLMSPWARSVGFGITNGNAIGSTGGADVTNTTPLNYNGTYRMSLALSDGTGSNSIGNIVSDSSVWDMTERIAVGGTGRPVMVPNVLSRTNLTLDGSWTSSNTSVLTADGNLLTAIAPGTTTLTFRATNGASWAGTITVQRFSDVNPGHAHESHIDWMYDTAISTGYKNADGTWRYEGMTAVYRQDMAAFLRRLAVKNNIGDAATWEPSASDWNKFKDVNKNTAHAEDILWLAHAGISEGWKESDGRYTFRGMSPVVRQDMAAFLKRLADAAHKSDGVTPKTDFTDVNSGTPHYQDIQWLGGSGVTEGYVNKDGKTRRYEGMTKVYRQDMAAFLHRLDTLLTK